ncbi:MULTISPECIES: hypothetical protein [Stenotrophomonas]|uniref:hypothetical protein n=1 Tax=Stenotrophomonas TaxID=40323 RepID=UPI00201D21AE|nr:MULTISPECIES: hypothetical protein [Stenotrophomonas]MBN5023712.1 hypothetical protein [Stenotrophomonas maltophilia]MDH1272361.1 hypothetical protein [Stenotrophomonas sp. GD03937]MDH1483329.1 hypothetical protein [Stenotrophomonas sp. GD03712]UQY96650.1 hypothetical protein LZ605_04595 [Stenotrophomonas maltophilia]WON70786.1 hypothetical protein RWT08_10800 [Stenotrophomonas maltophilia]
MADQIEATLIGDYFGRSWGNLRRPRFGRNTIIARSGSIFGTGLGNAFVDLLGVRAAREQQKTC